MTHNNPIPRIVYYMRPDEREAYIEARFIEASIRAKVWTRRYNALAKEHRVTVENLRAARCHKSSDVVLEIPWDDIFG